MAWDFQQCVILTSVDSYEPVQTPFKLRNSKWRSVSSLTIIEYSSHKQRLWSDCAYAQAGLRLCWLHIRNCWKSHALAQISFILIMFVISVKLNCMYIFRSGSLKAMKLFSNSTHLSYFFYNFHWYKNETRLLLRTAVNVFALILNFKFYKYWRFKFCDEDKLHAHLSWEWKKVL